jgi:hypothetical protein
MSGAGRHAAVRTAGGRRWRLLARAMLGSWRRPSRQRPAPVVSLGLENPVVAARMARVDSCEQQLAAVRTRLDEYDAAWAAMGPLSAAAGDDGHRHGLHIVRRELPG